MSHEVMFLTNEKRALLGQHHLIKNLMRKFAVYVKDVWSHKTLGMPKFLIVGPMVESEKSSAENLQRNWLGIGILLYLFKHSCPDYASWT